MLCLNLVLPLLDDGLCDVNVQGSRIPGEGGDNVQKSETRRRYNVGLTRNTRGLT